MRSLLPLLLLPLVSAHEAVEAHSSAEESLRHYASVFLADYGVIVFGISFVAGALLLLRWLRAQR